MLRRYLILYGFALSTFLNQFAHAEIPFEQAKGIYDATREDQKENSPLWGMVAIHSKILPHLRFFGPYGSYTKDLAQKFPEKRTAKSLQIISLIKTPIKPDDNAAKEKIERFKKLKKLYNSYSLAEFADVPQNYIAALIQLLFSSPDGAIFTTTVRNSPQDPLYKLVKGDKGQIDLTNMNRLLKAIINFKIAIKHDVKEEIQRAEQAIFELFAGKLTEKEQKTENHPYLAKLDQLKSSPENRDKFLSIYFAHILIQAVKEELTDAKIQSLYPKNICMIALLSYVWKVANKKSDLKPLTTLLSENATLDDQNQFSRKEYQQNKDNFVRALLAGSTEKDKLINPLSPEMIALFHIGYATYEERFPSPISYKHGVKYSGYEGGYPDCGETSLRNFFYYIFNQNGSFSQEYFKEFLRKIDLGSHSIPGKLKELQEHFKNFPSISAGSTQQAHDAWSEIVSGLDIAGGECPYQFGQNNKCVCNISGKRGLFNILTVIGKLIPDTELAAPWKANQKEKLQQMATKLNRLCELVNRDGFKLGWHIDSKKQISSETGFTLTLTINDEDAFVWNFLEKHFEIKKLTAEAGWPSQVSWSNQNVKAYPLLQAWFTQSRDLSGSEYQRTAQPFFIFSQDLHNNNAAIQAANYLFDGQYQTYYASAIKWLRPLFQDRHSLDQVKAMMIGYPEKLSLFSKEEQNQLNVKPEEVEKLLFQYILKYEYLSSLKKVIEWNKTIVNTKYQGDAPLHVATENGCTGAIKLLLEKGADIHTQNFNKNTSLHVAVQKGHIKIVELLLENGAIINAKGSSGETPLHQAADGGQTDTVKLLIEKGANVNANNNWNATPLHQAAGRGRTKVVELLLDKEALVNAKDQYNRTPLYEAVKKGHIEVVKLLIQRGAEVKGGDDQTPFHWAVERGDTEMMRLLLDNAGDNPKVNTKDSDGVTPLHLAVQKGYLGIVDLLLKKADIDAAAKNSALYWAASKGHTEIVKLLIENGADIRVKDRNGHMPLHFAASKGYTEIVKLLLKEGVEVDQRSIDYAKKDEIKKLLEDAKEKQHSAPPLPTSRLSAG